LKNKILIYILTLSMLLVTGCSNRNSSDNEDIGAETKILNEKDSEVDTNKDTEKNAETDTNSDADEYEDEELNTAVAPKHSGVKFDIDLDTHKSILPLTEDWEFYHDAEKDLKKEILTINGEVFDDSVLFFEFSDQYIAIVSDKDNFSSTFIALLDQTDTGFDVKFVERFRYSFNSAKEEVLIKDDEIILMTQFPFSSYSLFGKFIYEDNSITYDSLVDYDSSIAYYTEFMELLNEGSMDEAMMLEDYSSYPFSYESLYFKSGNLAIEKSLEFAKVAVKNDKDERAKDLLEWGLFIYLEKHYNYVFDKANIVFDNVYIKKDKDFGSEYLLSNEFMSEYLDFYSELYNKFEDEEKSEILHGKIEEFKTKLTAESAS